MPDDAPTCEVITLKSGAQAIRDRVTGEVMHPGPGPLAEAQDVYVGPSRLAARLAAGGPPLVLLDVGLGAATNAIAAWQVAAALPGAARVLEIVSFENDLGSLRMALRPAHAAAFGLDDPAVHAAATAIAAHGEHATARTRWRLCHGDFATLIRTLPPGFADVVFWDLFSPRTAPAQWTTATFAALRRTCRAGATLHTYSASTSTRAALLLAGFAVGVGAAFGDRAETTIAAVGLADLAAPLGAAWLARLARSQQPFGPDVPPADHAATIAAIRALPQFR